MIKFLAVLVTVIVADVAVAVWMVARPGPVSVTVATLVFVGGIAAIASGAFRLLWSPALASFPPRPPAPDAVRRRFQSFGLDLVNMGFSVHVAVDETHLHLDPLPIWKMLGAAPASIPWTAMEPIGRFGRAVRVDGHRLDGPKWCMALAQK